MHKVIFLNLLNEFVGLKTRSICSKVILGYLLLFSVYGCGSNEVIPVDIFPEDECTNCRMSISEHAFASEIISTEGVVFKFDDIDCFFTFKSDYDKSLIAAVFVKNYETKEWMAFNQSVIIETSIATPMGSGKVAVSNNERADVVLQKYPVSK